MSERWVTIKKVDQIYAQLKTNHPSLFKDVYEFLSHFVDNYRFMPKYKMGIWDGKINFLKKNGLFPIGLLKDVYKFIKTNHGKSVNVKLDKKLTFKFDVEDFADVCDSWLSENEKGNQWVPYKHQIEGSLASLKHNRCIIEHATSSGKSLTMALIVMYHLIKENRKKVLILVPAVSLVKQLTSDFMEYGVPEEWIGNFYAGQKDYDTPILISTWQSMCKQKQLIKEFDMIVCDEVHSLKGNEVRAVAENAINAKTRIGCTGTMPDSKVDCMQIQSMLGPIVHKISARELIDLGHASDIMIKIPYIFYDKETKKKLKGLPTDVEKKFLEEYEPRNNVIKYIVNKHHSVDHNCLILVDHIDHAELLVEKMKELGDDRHVILITGKVKANIREEYRKFVNQNKKCVIIATYGVFSVGISIKRLHAVIFASAGKSKIRVLQSIGRGLRLHKEKRRFLLYDIGDNATNSDRHLQERIKLYNKAHFDMDISEINLEKYNGSI